MACTEIVAQGLRRPARAKWATNAAINQNIAIKIPPYGVIVPVKGILPDIEYKEFDILAFWRSPFDILNWVQKIDVVYLTQKGRIVVAVVSDRIYGEVEGLT